MAEQAFNFIVKNDDVIIKFSCNNYKKRIGEMIQNLFVDKTNKDDDIRIKSKFIASSSDVKFFFDNEERAGTNIFHQAVFFENTDYPLIVKGNNKRLSFVDLVLAGHKRSDIDKKSQIISDGGELYGTLNFKNQVGETDFRFRYKLSDNDKVKELSFSTEVLSYKLDYRSDLKTIIADIEEEYALLSYSFLRDTYQHFRKGSGKSTELIWWQIFHSCFDEIIRNTKIIIDRPKRRLRSIPKCERAERLSELPRELENEYQIHKDNPAYLYRTEELVLSHDTIENRFLKHALRDMQQKFQSIRKHIMIAMKLSDPSRISIDLEEMEGQLLRINNHPFFRGIGQFKGFTQDNLVMKQGLGYKTILEKWIELQQGYELSEGIQKLEVKDISDLYEIWCFIKVKNIVQTVLKEIGEEAKPRVNGNDITRDFIPQLIYGGAVSFIKQNDIELASVAYNAEVEKEESKAISAVEDTDTLTTIQRPDIVLRLSKDEDMMKYTYLFDAKYRINDKTIDGEQVPPPDAIDQLHKYRDAIYYNKEQSLKKEIVAGYVLFPGTVNLQAIKNGTYYYQKSNKRVGIGAFPLKPDKEIRNEDGELMVNPLSSEQALYHQIKEWLTERNSRSLLLQRSSPQRGLRYQEEGMEEGVALIMMLHYEEKKRLFSNGKVAIPLKPTENGMTLFANQSSVVYVLFHTRKKDENKHLFRVKSIIRVLSKDDSEANGFYLVQTTASRYICVEIDLEKELDSSQLDPSKNNIPYGNKTERYNAQYARMDELKKP